MLPQSLRLASVPLILPGNGAGLTLPMTSTLEAESEVAEREASRSRVTTRSERMPAEKEAGNRPLLGEPWHFLQFSHAIDLELASAMAELSQTVLWEPDRSLRPVRPRFREEERRDATTPLRIRRFPVLRGYARPSIAKMFSFGPMLAERLAKHCPVPESAPLVCSTPYLASVAEHWPGPVVYWLTDLMARYEGAHPDQIEELDARLCRVATLVCPASHRLGQYLHEQAGCPAEKLQILPNATRAVAVPEHPLTAPEPWPSGSRSWAGPGDGPVAGVLGNLADNMDWIFLAQLIERTPWLSWAFVGPAGRMTGNAEQARARTAVQQHPRTHFYGAQPYCELFRFARSFTVAVLPYLHREPTYSGSSTRFYEHLAACHPILATPGVAELDVKEPILRLVRSPAEAAATLDHLRATGFDDGLRLARWWASRENTWHVRAETMRTALQERLRAGDAKRPPQSLCDGPGFSTGDVRANAG